MEITKPGWVFCLLLACGAAQACPDNSRESQAQRLQDVLKAGGDLAVVTVESETRSVPPVSAFAILRVVEGWGEPRKRHLTYMREEASCGTPQALQENGRYLVLLEQNMVLDIFEYAAAKKPLKALGKPHYKYDRKGRLQRSPPGGGA
jgi:hypothetical protein